MNRELNIDLLRILSIVIVIMSHYGLMTNSFFGGTHGVVLFFFVSGYCILLTSYKKDSFKAFWKARYIRLLPVFFLCTFIIAAFKEMFPNILPERKSGLGQFVFTNLCLPTFDLPCNILAALRGKGDYGFIEGAYWSLLVEFRYYLLFSILWYVLKLRKSVIFITIGFAFLSLFTQQYFQNRYNDFFLYLVFFSFGMSFYELLNKSTKIGIAGSFCSFLSFSALSFIGVQHLSFSISMNTFLSYSICFLIFIFVMMFFKKSRWSKPWLTYLAVLTYPIYLIHQEMGLIYIEILKPYIGNYAAGIFAIAAALITSHYLHIFSEKRISPLIKKYVSKLFTAF